ncbi:MAG: hypothetical protein HY653_02515 [Acidobacteria bacterium]|nr:hypothetical protein [Acidobacteriota bacterium]
MPPIPEREDFPPRLPPNPRSRDGNGLDLGGSGGAERFFPGGRGTKTIELLSAGLHAPVSIAYGRHIVGGNVIFQHKTPVSKDVVLMVALGEGEWDGPEVAWLNDQKFSTTNTAKYHFHPGLDGAAGVEADPAIRNQNICSFWPNSFRPQLTFSRTAYAALTIRRNSNRPKRTREFELFGVYKTRRVRLFDNAGNQTGYAYSTNPAWCALDLIISRVLKPHGLVNEALTAAEKARVDFQAFKDWADFCDETLTINGETATRWETHLAFTDEVDLLRALDAILLSGRAYLLERNGKLAPFADKTRSSITVIDADDILPDSLLLARRPLRDTPNLFRFTWRDLDSGRGLGSISSSGTTVTGVDTNFLTFFEKDGAIDLRSGLQKGEVRRVKSITSDTSLIIASAFSVNQAAGTLYANPARDFEERIREVADEDHQDAVGRIQPFEADLGNQSAERAERLAEYLRRSIVERTRRASFTILSGLPGSLNLLPGDVITAPADVEFLTARDYEIERITDNPDGSRAVEALEYVASVFVDAAAPAPQPPDPPDVSEAFADNAVQVANTLKNSSFFKQGVAGQEGTSNAKFFKLYSNAGGAPASPTDIEWKADRDVYILKTSTSSVDKIGIRSLWNNLGLMFKPGQPITVAVALRHAGASDLYNKDVKVKLDNDAETYTDPDGAKYQFTIPADTIGNSFEVFHHTFELRTDQAVPNTLNVFVWSEATGAAKSNHDLEIDWVTLVGGRLWVHFDTQAVSYSVTWQAGPGLYDIDGVFVKDTASSSDTGGAGEAAGGLGTTERTTGGVQAL